MKLRYLIENLDKSPANEAYIDIDELAKEFGIYQDFFVESTERLQGYYLSKWNCSGSWIGQIAIFLDNEFVGYSSQDGRKSDKKYYFLNRVLCDKLKHYIISLIFYRDYTADVCVDLDEEIGDGYTIEYNSELLNKFAKYLPTGEFVTILNWVKPIDELEEQYIDTELSGIYSGSISKIKFEDGIEKLVQTNTLEIPYPVILK
ncbi:MAG: hypothetical protein PHC28_12530 [Flavobacterium sp.]|uniref:hypothetical protein n=1 Tax=Flavobacterium sp. TaxID=239 RepID=UPI002612398F|nr:hypothetical protein [Flavobacterium sp.]MDD5151278.1 hypothetical protein [Flavobacterium sp.]